MKILFLNYTFGKIDRGAETFVKELSKRLKTTHQVEIISANKMPGSRWPILWRAYLDPFGISIFLFTFKNLLKILREKYDVIIPVDGGWQPALVRIVSWCYGGQMIISGQSGMGWDERNNLWCFPDCFVALSTFAKSWAKKVNPYVTVEYIPNGVDTTKFSPKGLVFRSGLRRPVILCAGALIKSKRIDLTIASVARMKNASLLLVGDGELKEKLANYGKKLLKDRFRMVSVPFESMPRVYRGCDVFTIASRPHHSFEVVLVEAMSTNLPVVAGSDPIRYEIVGNAGILVNPEDVNAYKNALLKALRTKWGELPRKQAEKFSWDKIAKNYEKLFSPLEP